MILQGFFLRNWSGFSKKGIHVFNSKKIQLTKGRVNQIKTLVIALCFDF